MKKALLILSLCTRFLMAQEPVYKELALDLNVGPDELVPQGILVDKRILLNLNQDDPLQVVSFKEIVDDDGKLVIALIHTGNPGDAKRSWRIYEAKEFNRSLIQKNKKPFDLLNQAEFNSIKSAYLDPEQQTPIGDTIRYFVLYSPNDAQFNYIGTDADYFTNPGVRELLNQLLDYKTVYVLTDEDKKYTTSEERKRPVLTPSLSLADVESRNEMIMNEVRSFHHKFHEQRALTQSNDPLTRARANALLPALQAEIQFLHARKVALEPLRRRMPPALVPVAPAPNTN